MVRFPIPPTPKGGETLPTSLKGGDMADKRRNRYPLPTKKNRYLYLVIHN